MKKISVVLNGQKITNVYEEGINSLDMLKNFGDRNAIAESCSPLGKCGKCTILVNGHPTLACLSKPSELANKYIQTMGAETLACLIQFNGFQLGRRFLLNKQKVTIGRGQTANITVKDNSISRKHLIIEKTDKGFFLQDLQSTNGTYVNFKEVKKSTQIFQGDMIRAGNVLLKFYEHDNIESAIHDRMYRLANYDQLTKVYNRKYVLEALEREILDAQTKKQKLSVIFVDLDHFKKVNDIHGHQAGDDVLRVTGLLLNKAVRTNDTVGRYGGEEFVIILPETDKKDAIKVAERIRKTIESYPYQLHLQNEQMQSQILDHKQTASLGVTWLEKGRNSVRNLLEESDKNLYISKSKGRNIVTASPLE